MARPNKQGLDYFPLDVDFFEDEKMLAISGEFAVKGEIIVLRILCEIYRNGYFVEYSELLKNKLARLGGLSGGLVDEVVKKLVGYNFFDGAIFREHKVLTSKGIQKRFFEVAKRRKDIDISHFWLLDRVNVDNNSTTNRVNVDNNSQSKVKESKEENIIPPISPFGESECVHFQSEDEELFFEIWKNFKGKRNTFEKDFANWQTKTINLKVDFEKMRNSARNFSGNIYFQTWLNEVLPKKVPAKKGRFDFKSALMELGVSEKVAEDWLIVRKNRRMSNTETAFDRIKNELNKSIVDADTAIRTAVENSWGGFKADWITNKTTENETGKRIGKGKERDLAELAKNIEQGYTRGEQQLRNKYLSRDT